MCKEHSLYTKNFFPPLDYFPRSCVATFHCCYSRSKSHAGDGKTFEGHCLSFFLNSTDIIIAINIELPWLYIKECPFHYNLSTELNGVILWPGNSLTYSHLRLLSPGSVTWKLVMYKGAGTEFRQKGDSPFAFPLARLAGQGFRFIFTLLKFIFPSAQTISQN